MTDKYHVIGVYRTQAGAAAAVDRLTAEGFDRSHISLMMTDEAKKRLFAVEKHTRAAEGAATGAITGGLLGALVAGLTIASTVAIPGLGILVAGPLTAAIAGAGAGGAAGTAVGGLIGFGFSEHEMKHLRTHLEEDCVVVGVQVVGKDDAALARDIFTSTGALQQDIQRGQHVVI